MNIPPFKYYFPKHAVGTITKNIRELLENGDFLALGKYNEEFEKTYANFSGSKHAIAVASGTSSLEIILRAIGVDGYDVIVPTNTFAATIYAVIHAGGKPVFADIAHDMNIDISNVKSRLTSKSKVILPVHIGGLISPHLPKLLEIAVKHNINVVEDAAHAQGSSLNNKKAGTLGIAGGFSFFSTKIITSGEGGIITTDNDEIMEKARLMRDQGKVRGNNVSIIGNNWRMSEFQAIVALSQLQLIDEIIEKRINVARIYDDLLKTISSLQLLNIPINAQSNYYKYLAFIPKGKSPDILKKHLKEKYGVSLAGYVYEAPLHRQLLFQKYIDNVESYPVADDLCNRHIALPIYPQMSEDEVRYVVESLKKSLSDLRWA